MNAITHIESEVPFGHSLYASLYTQGLQLKDIRHQGNLESRYLAWETVRKQQNPFFLKGTGFEGYLVGKCPDSQAALEAILNINQNILDAIARLYRFEYGFRSRLFKTLTKESDHPTSINVWASYFGAELGKLRIQTIHDPVAQKFRDQTYQIVHTLPPMIYREATNDILQKYAIGAATTTGQKIDVTLNMLPPKQQDAWLVAENIGEFGHPLVRDLLINQ